MKLKVAWLFCTAIFTFRWVSFVFQAALRNKSDLTGLEAGRLLPKQATTLLKRYPNLRTEI